MKKIFGALAALMLSLVLFAPPAEARCWWNGYRWHCSYYRHYVRHWYPYRYYGYYPYPYYYRAYYRSHYYRPYFAYGW